MRGRSIHGTTCQETALLREIIDVLDLLDDPRVDGKTVQEFLRSAGAAETHIKRVHGEHGFTDFVRTTIDSEERAGPTLGIIGRLGGIGARPDRLGLVSYADGAIVALACAAKLAKMAVRGDRLSGSVIVATHISPRSPIVPHEPAPFMGAPVDVDTMNRCEVDPQMEAILSIDATKGNWILNRRGFAITPTVKEGYSTGCSPNRDPRYHPIRCRLLPREQHHAASDDDLLPCCRSRNNHGDTGSRKRERGQRPALSRAGS